MKKIFRMATVLAVSCAALTYTSCTKDYSGDIDDLNAVVSELQNNHKSDVAKLEAEIAALKTTLVALQGVDSESAETVKGIKAQIAAAETQIAAIQTAMLNKVDESTLNTKLAAVSTEIASAKSELKTQIDALAAELSATKEDLLAKIGAKADASEFAALQEKVAALEAAVAENTQNITDLYQTSAGLSAQIGSVATILNELQAALEELGIETLPGAVADLNSRLATLWGDVDAINELLEANNVDGLKSTITEIQNRLNSHAGDLDMILELLEANNVDGLRGTIEAIMDSITATNEYMDEKIDGIWELLNSQNVETLKGDLQALNNRCDAIIEDYDEKIVDLQAQIDGIVNSKLSAVVIDLARVNTAATVLANELRGLVFIPEGYYYGVETGYIDVYEYEIDTVAKSDTYNYAEIKPVLDSKTSVETFEFVYNDNTVYFDLNPSSFDVNNAEWDIVGERILGNKLGVNSANTAGFDIKVKNVSKENGQLKVDYSFEITDTAVVYGTLRNIEDLPNITAKLVAKLDANRTISSNTFAVSFKDEIVMKPEFVFDDGVYSYADAATAKGAYANELAYNETTGINLADTLGLHKNDTDTITVAQINEKLYSNFSIKYNVVEITADGVKQPAYATVDENGVLKTTWQAGMTPSDYIGKTVIVLVELSNEKNEVLAAQWLPYTLVGTSDKTGYRKIDGFIDVVLPYTCRETKAQKILGEFADSLYKVDPALSDLNYELDTIYGGVAWDTVKVYTEVEGKMVVTPIDTDNIKAFLRIKHNGMNFEIKPRKLQPGTITRYIKCSTKSKAEDIYLEVKIRVAEKPLFDLTAARIESEWLENTIMVNTTVPGTVADSHDTLYIQKTIEEAYAYENLKIVDDPDSYDLTGNDLNIKFQFTENFPEITGYEFSLVESEAKDTSYVFAGADTVAFIATNDTKNVVRLYNSPSSKKLLNEHNADFKLEVEAIATNSSYPCIENMLKTPEKFYVQFVTPLTLEAEAAGVIKNEANLTGMNYKMSDAFASLKDWQNHKMNEKVGKNELELFSKYGISSISVDFDAAKRTQSLTNLNKIEFDGNLSLLKKEAGNYVPINSPVEVSKTADLEDVVLHYENAGNVTQGYYIYVPVSIKYHWGDLDTTIKLEVKATK